MGFLCKVHLSDVKIFQPVHYDAQVVMFAQTIDFTKEVSEQNKNYTKEVQGKQYIVTICHSPDSATSISTEESA